MEKAFKRYTVTSALPYANGPLHLGHLAGAYLPADIYVRYLRAKNKDVLFICGTDEHGAAINMKARKEGTTPQEIVDKYYEMIKTGFEGMKISFDHFSRTSREIHHETAQAFFKTLYNDGVFEEKTADQLFDPEAQMFLADRFVKGTCPKCSHPEAYGDQCENCGSALNATELINPVSTLSGAKPILKETKHWYLPLNNFQDQLESFISSHEEDWKTNVVGQCKSWLKEGLQPRAITRDLDWGVEVPVEGGEGKVLYVWFDAPIGYISSSKEWAAESGDPEKWKPYWQDEETALIHFIGKDNIVFHCIIFPAILMAEGNYILPENVPANEFLNLEGGKFSTSRNHAVWINDFIEELPGQVDVLRYVLTATMPETKDSDFNWEEYQTRNNKELLGDLGNYVNRVVVLTKKYYDGKVPAGEPNVALIEEVKNAMRSCGDSIEKFRLREALNEAMNMARAGNKNLADTEPWKLIKTDPEKVKDVMYTHLQIVALLSVAFDPFIPDSAKKIADILNFERPDWDLALNQAAYLGEGHQIKEPEHLFQKLEDSFVENQRAKLESKDAGGEEEESKVIPQKEFTSFDDFQKMDIRVGTILEAEEVPKSKKLIRLQVDTGIDTRQILSGVKEHFKPEELVGKSCLVLVNLPPRKMMGLESQGMLLFAEDKEGKMTMVGALDDTENGATVN